MPSPTPARDLAATSRLEPARITEARAILRARCEEKHERWQEQRTGRAEADYRQAERALARFEDVYPEPPDCSLCGRPSPEGSEWPSLCSTCRATARAHARLANDARRYPDPEPRHAVR